MVDFEKKIDLILERLESIAQRLELQSKDLLTIDEASAYLSLSKQTLYQKCQAREIPYIKKGKLYFSRTALNKWLLQGGKKTVEELKYLSYK